MVGGLEAMILLVTNLNTNLWTFAYVHEIHLHSRIFISEIIISRAELSFFSISVEVSAYFLHRHLYPFVRNPFNLKIVICAIIMPLI